MTRDEILAALESEQGVPARFIYLLDVIPLVEMLWADGRNQEAEVALVKKFLVEHLAELETAAGDNTPITVEEIDHFLERFVLTRPEPALLARLRELAECNIAQAPDPSARSRTVLEYCLDIASAAVTHYPHGYHERFEQAEKQALWKLMSNLELDPEQAVT
jgi:hypothetical protein